MRGHLLARDHGGMDPAPVLYRIRINGHLGATVLSAFPALVARHHGAHTVLTGLLDRSALYGVLAEIEALGLDLLEVCRLTPDRKSPESGDSCSPRRPLPSGASLSLRERAAPMTSAPVRDPLADHLLTPENSALLLIDYQPAQISAVQSMDRDLLLKNAVSTVRTVKTFGIPVVHSTINVASGRGQPTLPNSPIC